MLDIAVSYSRFAHSTGGARESLLTLLEGVADRRDIEITAYQPTAATNEPDRGFEYELEIDRIVAVPAFTWVNRVATGWQWKRNLRRSLRDDHDLLITQTDLAPASISVANEKSIPSVYLTRSLALTGYDKLYPGEPHLRSLTRTDFGGAIQYPFLQKTFSQHRRAVQDATATVPNSEFMAGKLTELFGVQPRSPPIYPPIRMVDYRVDRNDDGYITMVNPRTRYKGPDIFLDIAEQLPDEEFLMVGDIASADLETRAAAMPNVTHWEWCEDMRDAYAETKAVVVPSRVEESFGRVPAEAMVSGIPCVVSDRGGLPEVVGDTGEVVSSLESPPVWIDAIDEALSNHDPKKQKRRAERFSAKRQIEAFDTLLTDISDQ